MPRGTTHGPKTDGTRRRRNAPTYEGTTLVRDGHLRGPTIKAATGRTDWEPEVTRWWETWRRSPQASVFEETDWQRLAMLVYVVDEFFTTGSAKLLGEIRINEERLGATVVDRMRARMKITDPADAADLVAVPAARDDVAARLRNSA